MSDNEIKNEEAVVEQQENTGFRVTMQGGLLVVEHKSGDYIALAPQIAFDPVQFSIDGEVRLNDKYKPEDTEEATDSE